MTTASSSQLDQSLRHTSTYSFARSYRVSASGRSAPKLASRFRLMEVTTFQAARPPVR